MAEKNVDPHKMSSEELKKYGMEGARRPPGHHPGEILHQRRSLPFTTTQMTVAGFLICSALGYFTLYAKAKPEASATDVAKATVGVPGNNDPKNRSSVGIHAADDDRKHRSSK